MSEEMMNTKEVAKHLGIHEKQVYALIKSKRIPSTRVTGKWVFPKKLIDDWIESNAQKSLVQAREKSRRIEGALLASGSNDPILDILHTYMRNLYPEFYIFTANTGSTDGLKALNKGYTDIAWSHLFDPKTNEYNIPFLPNYVPNIKPVVVNLFCRDMGFLVAAKNPLGIHGFEDLARKEVRFINRQKGAGTRVLLDYYLKKLRIPSSEIKGYEKEVYTHLEVGISVLSKESDVGIGTIAVSKFFGLSFIPITTESFDMVLDQPTFFEKGVQAFVEVLNSDGFRKRITKLGNYDFKNSGKILYSKK
ncbi:MAG: helix-turn-helix transcriptional regulator [Desulfobacterales bacterium]|nr:helix-turn-helix transcriptional regulator [Desulfobacterales bacterium]